MIKWKTYNNNYKKQLADLFIVFIHYHLWRDETTLSDVPPATNQRPDCGLCVTPSVVVVVFSLFVLVAGVVVAAEFAVFFFVVQLIVLLILLGCFFYFCDTLRLVNKQQQLQRQQEQHQSRKQFNKTNKDSASTANLIMHSGSNLTFALSRINSGCTLRFS